MHVTFQYSVYPFMIFLNGWSINVIPILVFFSLGLHLVSNIIGCANNINNLSLLAFNLLVFVGLLDSRNRRARGHVSSPTN